MEFKDYFSATARDYARVRPVPPARLIGWLAELCERRDLAWDAGTGNGQTAAGLAAWFRRVAATDASRDQLAQAARRPNMIYVNSVAERSGLRSHTADLVTASQAVHWFDIPAFFAEAARVLRPGGVIAVWVYTQPWMGAPFDDLLERFEDVIHSFWPPERRIVIRRLRGLPFPFHELRPPGFAMSAELTLEGLRRYLETWSASQQYRAARGRSPVDEIDAPLRAAWGDPAVARRLTWPLHLRAGRRV
ncbi:MAG: class I SAM-dependent methyltransferase [Candidatus Sumerlaeia bacterium]